MPLETAVLLVHGGAGAVPEVEMTPDREADARAALERALRAGFEVLASGGASLDAVEAAVRVLEDHPAFNAGRGAVLNRDGRIELDAAIMEGRTYRAGAVAGLTRVRNPITAARRVMDASGHVMLAGPGTDAFAEAQGLETVDPAYFQTEARLRSYFAAAERVGSTLSEDRFGTVGAVALDRSGSLAAASSTGGMTFKRPGRVGDSPVIGGGVYADDLACAVSCTGDGEVFLRLAAAHEVVALVKYAGLPVTEAARRVVFEQVARLGGEGGLLALGPDGRYAMPFNARGMYRGVIDASGVVETAIY